MMYTFLMKNLGMSFEEVRSLSPDQRSLIISCLQEHYSREKEALEKASREATGKQPSLTSPESKEDYSKEVALPTDVRKRIEDIVRVSSSKERKGS